MNSVIANNLSKSFGKVKALDNVSFEIQKGELFGFIGPDGAGKTTLFKILTTLLLADEGTAVVDGFDVVKDYKKIRKLLGYMPGKFSLYQDLSVEENLSFFATIFGTTIKENYHLIKDIYSQIEPFKKRRAGALSGGMKQKLALSCAMIHKPDVLVLDEPTTGVDAVSRKEFWEMLKKLKESGITILVSTPYMDEASLCDRVALMQNGSIMMIDKPAAISGKYKKNIFAIRAENMYQLLQELKKCDLAESVYPFGQYLHFTPKDNNITIAELDNCLKDKNIIATEIKQINANIEDVFMELMTKGENSESITDNLKT
jgi:ABC-type multidrug transport system ATPase subunit